jgi:hypothetical protein
VGGIKRWEKGVCEGGNYEMVTIEIFNSVTHDRGLWLFGGESAVEG